jgi:hypothetical protein
MSGMDRWIRVGLVGAILLLLAAVLVVAANSENAATAVVLGVIAVGIGAWIWRVGSRASAISTLVVGGLLMLVFGLFVAGDSSSGESVDGLVVVGDVVALAAGLVFVACGIMAIRSPRSEPAL